MSRDRNEANNWDGKRQREVLIFANHLYHYLFRHPEFHKHLPPLIAEKPRSFIFRECIGKSIFWTWHERRKVFSDTLLEMGRKYLSEEKEMGCFLENIASRALQEGKNVFQALIYATAQLQEFYFFIFERGRSISRAPCVWIAMFKTHFSSTFFNNGDWDQMRIEAMTGARNFDKIFRHIQIESLYKSILSKQILINKLFSINPSLKSLLGRPTSAEKKNTGKENVDSKVSNTAVERLPITKDVQESESTVNSKTYKQDGQSAATCNTGNKSPRSSLKAREKWQALDSAGVSLKTTDNSTLKDAIQSVQSMMQVKNMLSGNQTASEVGKTVSPTADVLMLDITFRESLRICEKLEMSLQAESVFRLKETKLNTSENEITHSDSALACSEVSTELHKNECTKPKQNLASTEEKKTEESVNLKPQHVKQSDLDKVPSTSVPVLRRNSI